MKTTLIFLLLLSVILLVGCQEPQSASTDKINDDTNSQTAPAGQQIVDETKLTEIQMMDKAINEQNAKLCDDITNQGIRTGCYDRVVKVKAIETGDIASCDQIENAGIRNDCKNLINQKKQNAPANPESNVPSAGTDCSVFTNNEEKVNCENLKIRTIALEQKDASLCSGISVPEMKENCENNVYQNLAIQDKDLTKCNQISIPALVESCKNNVYSNKAFFEKNVALCNQITNQQMVKSCQTRLG